VQLQTWTTIEIRSVIRFLNARSLPPAEIHQQLVDVYGVTALSRKQVYFWCNEFSAGRTNVVDEQRSGRHLLHDNATPHTAAQTREWLERYKWDVLCHPPYSPDLAPSDFYLFGPLKRHLSGQTFTTDAECETAVKQWLSSNVRQFYQDGIIALVPRWDKCLNRFGDYVEK